MKKEIKIPDIAENVESGIIGKVLVSKGEKIKVDQSVVEVETDKATTDIPSPYEGIVDEIKVDEGDEVKVNQVIMIIETEEEEDEEQKETEEKGNEEEEIKKKEESGAREIEAKEKEEKKPAPPKQEKEKDMSDIPASPSVRRLARELDIDLTKVTGSGPGDRITAEDVKNYAQKPEREEKEAEVIKTPELPDFSQWGPTSREKMTNIRKITSRNVSQSWQNIPHVTQFDEADITNLENFRKQHKEKIEKWGGKLTVTAILLKISAFALQKFPRFNASLDMNNQEIIYKHYYNIGIAVDTQQGLIVPVVQNVNSKSLKELAVEVHELAQRTRDKKISPDELQGGNFTVSNLGGIGGTSFAPVILPPQVAILGVARSVYKQVYSDGEFRKKLMLPLSVSYDHRIIDGADGARFLRWICDVIEDPYSILF
jgi:pyruvate dehydrogenase E2 component (dihydrolipoamide acetyltransferase)